METAKELKRGKRASEEEEEEERHLMEWGHGALQQSLVCNELAQEAFFFKDSIFNHFNTFLMDLAFLKFYVQSRPYIKNDFVWLLP